MKKDKSELTENNLKRVTGGKQTCNGYASVEFPQSDSVNPIATKSWFSTADESTLRDK